MAECAVNRTSLSQERRISCASCGTAFQTSKKVYEVLIGAFGAQDRTVVGQLCETCGDGVIPRSGPSTAHVTFGLSDWPLTLMLHGVTAAVPDLGSKVVHIEVSRCGKNQLLLEVLYRSGARREYTYAPDTRCLAPVISKPGRC